MRRILILAGLVSGVITQSHAIEPNETMRSLMGDCQQTGSDQPGKNFCLGYVGGIASMMVIMKYSPGNAGSPFAICQGPTAVTFEDDVDVFLSWAKLHPEKADQAGIAAVMSAMHEKWPCPTQGPSQNPIQK